MNYLIYLGHPAHYHLFKNIITALKTRGHKVDILIKKKDILEDLLKKTDLHYFNILPEGRKKTKFHIALGLLKRDWRMLIHCLKNKPDLLLGTSVEITHVGKILGIPSIIFNEDDYDYIPLFAKLGFPFASAILAPTGCRVGKWKKKTFFYNGYHESTYISENNFKPDRTKIEHLFNNKNNYFIIRVVNFGAHHDFGRKGLTLPIINELIRLLEPYGNIYITSEKELDKSLKKHIIRIDPHDIHHALFFASMYIGDSQSMAMEAAVLGVPGIRFNNFSSEISVLNELEQKYQLTHSISAENPQQLFNKVNELLSTPDIKEEFLRRRTRMLADKIDVTSFMVWFIENYPESKNTLRKNPGYQLNFK